MALPGGSTGPICSWPGETGPVNQCLMRTEWFLGFPLSDGGLLIPIGGGRGGGEFPIGKLMQVTFSRD